MSRLYRLYQNPPMPQARYFVRIVELRTEPANRRPFIELVLRVSDHHGGYGGTLLYCPIHNSEKADRLCEAFLNCFDLDENELDKAKDRYARLVVEKREYKGTTYSGVRFVTQRGCDYAEAATARKADKARAAREEEKAAEKAKKKALKQKWEALHGKRGRGRPRKDAVLMKMPDLLG